MTIVFLAHKVRSTTIGRLQRILPPKNATFCLSQKMLTLSNNFCQKFRILPFFAIRKLGLLTAVNLLYEVLPKQF